MSEKLFEGLLDDKNRETANKSLYNSFDARNTLKKEIENSVIGLDDLLDAITKSHYVVVHNNKEATEMRKHYDKIAIMLEKFVPEFKRMYTEVTAIEVAQKLSGGDDEKNVATLGGSGLLHSALTIDTSIWKNKHTFVEDNYREKLFNDLVTTPIKQVNLEPEKGWKGKKKK